MQFKRSIKIEYGLRQIIIAPLIDTVLLLLIFFVLTSSSVMPANIKVQLPRAITSKAIKEESTVITITSEDIIYLNNAVTTQEELRNALSKPIHKTRAIFIKADRRSSLGRLITIWDLCRELGIEQINIATTQE